MLPEHPHHHLSASCDPVIVQHSSQWIDLNIIVINHSAKVGKRHTAFVPVTKGTRG